MSERVETSHARVAHELCRAVREGDPGAWERVVAQYGRLVLAIPRDLGLSEEECEEVFQTTWLALYRDIRRLERPGALPKWISTTARRHSWRALERRRREGTPVEPDPEVPGPAPEGPTDGLLSAERRHAVHESIAELSPRCRDLLLMLFFDRRERSYAELAQDLGVAEGSVGPGRMRCLAELARILERKGFRTT